MLVVAGPRSSLDENFLRSEDAQRTSSSVMPLAVGSLEGIGRTRFALKSAWTYQPDRSESLAR
jgi:hypothetical protein